MRKMRCREFTLTSLRFNPMMLGQRPTPPMTRDAPERLHPEGMQ